MVWAKNGSPVTLTGTASTASISDMTSTVFNVIMVHYINSGEIATGFRVSGDSASNYAFRTSKDGAADGARANEGSMNTMLEDNHSYPVFAVHYLVDISGEEKLVIANAVRQNTAGASNMPTRQETVAKHATTAVITSFDIYEAGSGDFAADTNISALGTD